MTAWKWLAPCLVCASAAHAQAPEPPDDPPDAAQTVEDAPPPRAATNRITAVTVYQAHALVTRRVEVPEGKGIVELVVTPLPPRTVAGALYAEGSDGIRVLSTRHRARAVRADTRANVRALEQKIAALQAEAERTKNEIDVSGKNLGLLGKLEGFTGATLAQLTEKGRLDSESTIALTKYVMDTRKESAAHQVGLQQTLAANAETRAFIERQLAELTAGSSRTERDAVIVVDKVNAPAGDVTLHYLVGAATWRPQYRLKAGGEKDAVQVEYLAAVAQQTGEDWPDVGLVLSTAQPTLSATLPDLKPLDLATLDRDGDEPDSAGEEEVSLAAARAEAQVVRGKAQQELLARNVKASGALLNEAAGIDQAGELLGRDDDEASARERPAENPSVTYRLDGRRTVPSRRDPQLVEVGRFELTPAYFAKAVPVLSPRVYRLARFTNTSDFVLLPGEATMSVETDFVGRMDLPLVAAGEPFTVGFGIDPQIQVGRRLVKKGRSVQGGNQVRDYEFRITVRSYKSTPVTLQVWDRLPKAEGEAVSVNVVESTPSPSADPLYQRTARTDNLLRWDLTIPPGSSGEKALIVLYKFTLEYAREKTVRYLTAGGIHEAPIGGMGGMGGGMGGMRSLGQKPGR
jgi:uncharacterized protein (TIGR02231 family)